MMYAAPWFSKKPTRLAAQQAVAITAEAPQSLPIHRFVVSLNEMNNIHERRLTALRYRVPGAVTFTLIGVAMMAMGSPAIMQV
jgi:hypothetical protein